MDIRQLRYFTAVAECGSFSAAAEKINAAQSALSLHVGNIEKRFGVNLFTRGARGVQLTGTGHILLDHARVILRQHSLAERELKREATAPSGAVALGIASAASRVLMGPLIQDMQVNMPNVNIQFVEALTGHLSAWLQEEKIQLAVNYSAAADAPLPWELTQENFYLVAPPGFEFHDDEIPLEKIGSFPLILPTGDHSPPKIVGMSGAELGVTLDIKYEVDSLDVILTMVRAGEGFSVLTPSAFMRELHAGEVQAKKIVAPVIRRIVCVEFAKYFSEDPLILAVADQVVQTSKRLVISKEWPQEL